MSNAGTWERRRLTQEQLAKEAAERFGPDPLQWAFQCPVCGDIATAAEFPPASRERISQECIGRHQAERGCDFAAYGLIPGPWEIELTDGDGKTVRCFPFAPAPPQQPASQEAEAAEAGESASLEAADQRAAFAYWAVWAGDPLVLKVLHHFDATLTDAQARAEIEKFDADNPEDVPWTTGAPYLLEPLTAPRLRLLRRLALGKDPVAWADAHGFTPAEQGVGCRHCGKDSSAHLGYAV